MKRLKPLLPQTVKNVYQKTGISVCYASIFSEVAGNCFTVSGVETK